MSIRATCRALLAACVLALAGLSAQAQGPADASAAASAAPAAPRADESNAERAKSQPGNNAPFWRAVRESGHQAGFTTLPGAEKGVLIQPFVQYPGSRWTTAGEAWRQVRNQWILPYGGALLLIVVLALGLFYKARGTMKLHAPETISSGLRTGATPSPSCSWRSRAGSWPSANSCCCP